MSKWDRMTEEGPWQPIETAPKDEGIYLVWMPLRSLDPYSCQWWDEREGGFSNDFGITHWMPLPAPPAPDGGRGLREDKTR
jgi:hypothetical protein